MSMKIPMTPAGIEPATFRFVAQHLNHCATAVILVSVHNHLHPPSPLKIGAAPFHWWFPGVIEGLRWGNCALLITVQNCALLITVQNCALLITVQNCALLITVQNCALLITVQNASPLVLTSYLMIAINAFTSRIILKSTAVWSVGGLNQTSTRKILTYSSINHFAHRGAV